MPPKSSGLSVGINCLPRGEGSRDNNSIYIQVNYLLSESFRVVTHLHVIHMTRTASAASGYVRNYLIIFKSTMRPR